MNDSGINLGDIYSSDGCDAILMGVDDVDVSDTPSTYVRKVVSMSLKVALILVVLLLLVLPLDLKVNAAEINYSIDNVMNNQFANFPYRILAKSGDNYMVFYSDNTIFYTSSTRYACNSGTGTCGYTAMMIENNELVVNPSGNSGTFDLTSGLVEINVFGYSEVIWASQNVPNGSKSNDTYVTTGIYFDTSNNAVYVSDVSDDTGTTTPDDNSGTDTGDDASTTPGAPVVDAAAIYEPICYKLDLIIMLLIVIFAAYMFKVLANPYKMGGKHIGKSG